MRVLEDGAVRGDDWIIVEDETPLPPGRAIVDLARLPAEMAARGADGAELGVRLHPGDSPEGLSPWLDRLSLVALEMPGFRDGRAFSQARALREQHGFTGEIRMLGQPLPDQLLFLLRCGVSSVALPGDADVAEWLSAAQRFSVAYQDSVREEPAINLLRRRLPLDATLRHVGRPVDGSTRP